MAMYVFLTQPDIATFGNPCRFVAQVQNTGGSSVSISSLALKCVLSNGTPAAAWSQEAYAPTPASSDLVSGASSVYRTLRASFFGQAINGANAEGDNRFLVSAIGSFSDGTTFESAVVPVGLAGPTWGVQGGPPQVSPLYQPALQFVDSRNSFNHAVII